MPEYVDPTLFFSYRDNSQRHTTLAIETGANEITWGYGLRTQTIPTYGGEVKQILGINIGNMTIHGNTKDNRQLHDIYDWFRQYMINASGFAGGAENQRSEVAVKFRYPARGWEFDVQILEAPGYSIGLELLGTEWQVVCFVVPAEDRMHILEATTMNDFNESIVIKNGQWSIPIGVGYIPHNQFSEDLRNEKYSVARNLGDNFQRFVAGGFESHWAGVTFDGAGEPKSNDTTLNPPTPADYWTSKFGSDQVALINPSTGALYSSGDSGSTSGTGGDLSTLSGTLTGEQVAALAYAQGVGHTAASSARGIILRPASDTTQLIICVAIAKAESGWNVGDINHNGDGTTDRGVWQINSSHTGAGFDPQLLLSDPTYNAKAMWNLSRSGSDWNAWTGTYVNGRYLQYMSEATAAVNNFLANPTAYTSSSPMRQRAIDTCQWAIANHGAPNILYAEVRPMTDLLPLKNRTLPFTADCSSFVTGVCYAAGAPDPNGSGYNGSGNTDTLLSNLAHISLASVLPMDIVVWHGNGVGHAAMFLEAGTVGDPLICSHGTSGDPKSLKLSAMTSSFSFAGPTVTYLRVVAS